MNEKNIFNLPVLDKSLSGRYIKIDKLSYCKKIIPCSLIGMFVEFIDIFGYNTIMASIRKIDTAFGNQSKTIKYTQTLIESKIGCDSI